MTKETILKASDTDLPGILGEVLREKPYSHQIVAPWRGDPPVAVDLRTCKKCHCSANSIGNSCSISDPIPLTPDNQVKYRDRAVEKWGIDEFEQTIIMVLYETKTKPCDCVGSVAQPRHYLQAAAICEIKETK